MEAEEILTFLKDCTPLEKERVKKAIFFKTYEKGTLIHKMDGQCQGLIGVLSGTLKVYIVSEEGREVTLFKINEGEVCVLSASCLMDSIDFDVVICATENTRALVLPSVVLNSLMSENPLVELFIYKTATEKFSLVMWSMQQILFKKLDVRIAAFLYKEAKLRNTMDLTITHDEVASSIGSAREAVSKTLKYMTEQGSLKCKRGKIQIINFDRYAADIPDMNLPI